MSLSLLERGHWQAFFDAASKSIDGQAATVELSGLQLGDRLAADHVPLIGLSYEPREDTLTLFLDGLQHRIAHPQAIHVEHSDGALASFEAVDEEGVHHIVLLHAVLEMPAL
jgi:hypothetical protein